MIKIKRALISVWDKTGLDALVRFLNDCNIEIVSTGGTAKFISKLGIPVKLVSDFTQSEEMLSGRVKTLHPKIHGALLALRENKDHMQQVQRFNIALIDMVVVNLYPFEKTVATAGVSMDEAVENIDIGGPSMLRSAAKNSKSVAVICNPNRYDQIISTMKANKGAIDEKLCFELAAEVFRHTCEYDMAIANYLKRGQLEDGSKEIFPNEVSLKFSKIQTLRYGENSHQRAAFYKEINAHVPGLTEARQLHGKELSFNNILDLDVALNIVKSFAMPAASIIKHNNPCGVAMADKLATAYKDALACDVMSAFGSIIGLNCIVDGDTAELIFNADFVECVIAPEFSLSALSILKKKRNIRLIETGDFFKKTDNESKEWDFKRVSGGLLIQEKDTLEIDDEKFKVVTDKKPTKTELQSLLFSQKVVKHVKSNAIVISKGTKTVGIGAGQMSRVDSVIIAIRKAHEKARGAVLASDAFFPKADAIEEAAKAGICAIIQPGGSIRDKEVITAANASGIAMITTGIRHFKH